MSKVDELTERAEKARGKKAAYGPDIPPVSYTHLTLPTIYSV